MARDNSKSSKSSDADKSGPVKACEKEWKAYTDCKTANPKDEATRCKKLLETLKQCETKEKAGSESKKKGKK